MKVKYIKPLIAVLFIFNLNTGLAQNFENRKSKTICNPINLNYRYALDAPSRREAADPVIVTFKNEYYLFASKSGGYWNSADLINWGFITSDDLPFEDYAPTAVVIGDYIYFTASTQKESKKIIYKSSNPKSGKWEIATDAFPFEYPDPELFLDDDGRLYLYYGCSDVDPIYAVELNAKTLMPIGNPVVCFYEDTKNNGWERPGDDNKSSDKPWTEGASMIKHNNKYYLQYSTPGTEYRSYCDGVYVADAPLGPFRLLENNPFSYRPGGFATGAGHSGTFKDLYGNYWHITTSTISVKHKFERRLSLYPVFFKDDNAYTYTGFGDYPILIPSEKVTSETGYASGWMLLSYNKAVRASSTLNEHEAINAADEDIRTYWSAKTGNKGEWLSIDLEKSSNVHAVQLNFAEHDAGVFGIVPDNYYQYIIEYSEDGKKWNTLIDKSENTADAPHDYTELNKAVKARFLKITNLKTPNGKFAISGFRIFGKQEGKSPKQASGIAVTRNKSDRCQATITWKEDKNATGYNVRYGRTPDNLYLNYQLYGTNTVDINSLSAIGAYYFTVDSFNESGITKGTEIIKAE